MKKSEPYDKNTLVRSGIANAAISKAHFQYDVQNIKAILSLETPYVCMKRKEN